MMLSEQPPFQKGSKHFTYRVGPYSEERRGEGEGGGGQILSLKVDPFFQKGSKFFLFFIFRAVPFQKGSRHFTFREDPI